MNAAATANDTLRDRLARGAAPRGRWLGEATPLWIAQERHRETDRILSDCGHDYREQLCDRANGCPKIGDEITVETYRRGLMHWRGGVLRGYGTDAKGRRYFLLDDAEHDGATKRYLLSTHSGCVNHTGKATRAQRLRAAAEEAARRI